MNMLTWGGILLPFLGTAIGASGVFCLKRAAGNGVRKTLAGFSSGIMVAASVWSLLIPAVESAADYGAWAFLPALIGFWSGAGFLLLLERSRPTGENGVGMMTFAVVLHNIPEGMAVGAVFAGWCAGNAGVTLAEAMALSLGISIQNIPEGAIISMPLTAAGRGRKEGFRAGVLSGAVEPLGAILTILAAGLIVPLMPYFLSFAAGAMVTVAIEELIPEAKEKGPLWFSVGFTLMMALDVALG